MYVLLACVLRGPSFTGLEVCVCETMGTFSVVGGFVRVPLTDGLETTHTQPFHQDARFDVWVVRARPGPKNVGFSAGAHKPQTLLKRKVTATKIIRNETFFTVLGGISWGPFDRGP